jgi:hypothetical protein
MAADCLAGVNLAKVLQQSFPPSGNVQAHKPFRFVGLAALDRGDDG